MTTMSSDKPLNASDLQRNAEFIARALHSSRFDVEYEMRATATRSGAEYAIGRMVAANTIREAKHKPLGALARRGSRAAPRRATTSRASCSTGQTTYRVRPLAFPLGQVRQP